MLVPTLTNHVDSLPLKAHWLNADLPNDPSTHPHLFLGPCSFSPGFFTVSPECVRDCAFPNILKPVTILFFAPSISFAGPCHFEIQMQMPI